MMQHRVVDKAQLETCVPMSPAGSDDEQVGARRGFQECLPGRLLDHLAAQRYVRVPFRGLSQRVVEHLRG